MMILKPLLRSLKPTRIWSLKYAVILLFVQGCDGVTLLTHDYCLRDTLILVTENDVVEGSVTETEIIAHNARLECGCSNPPVWCEDDE